jgi:hypothetical protein
VTHILCDKFTVVQAHSIDKIDERAIRGKATNQNFVVDINMITIQNRWLDKVWEF